MARRASLGRRDDRRRGVGSASSSCRHRFATRKEAPWGRMPALPPDSRRRRPPAADSPPETARPTPRAPAARLARCGGRSSMHAGLPSVTASSARGRRAKAVRGHRRRPRYGAPPTSRRRLPTARRAACPGARSTTAAMAERRARNDALQRSRSLGRHFDENLKRRSTVMDEPAGRERPKGSSDRVDVASCVDLVPCRLRWCGRHERWRPP